MIREASMSACGRYRHTLLRRWGEGPTCGFVMLNPSTADAEQDDPTIRRCIGFARREGAGALLVANLFSLRATDPQALKAAPEPHGPDEDRQLLDAIRMVDGPLIVGWGAHGSHRGRAEAVEEMIGHRMVCLGKTKGGAPRHPLYVRADAPLVPLADEVEP